MAIHESFLCEIWDVVLIGAAKASNLQKFSWQNRIFHQFVKVFSLGSFLLYGTMSYISCSRLNFSSIVVTLRTCSYVCSYSIVVFLLLCRNALKDGKWLPKRVCWTASTGYLECILKLPTIFTAQVHPHILLSCGHLAYVFPHMFSFHRGTFLHPRGIKDGEVTHRHSFTCETLQPLFGRKCFGVLF